MKKVLVLGEAEYPRTPGQKASQGDTESCIESEAIPKGGRFYSVVAGLMTGALPSSEQERARFWRSLMYYNYVQEQVAGPRIAPNSRMWAEGRKPFFEVLQRHSPEFIVVLGFRTWSFIPSEAREGRYISTPPPLDCKTKGNSIRQTYWYKTGAGEALAIAVKHPSAGFDFVKWHTWLRSAVPEMFRRVAPKSTGS